MHSVGRTKQLQDAYILFDNWKRFSYKHKWEVPF